MTTPQSASETFDDARDDEDGDGGARATRARTRARAPVRRTRARVPVEREDDETARDGGDDDAASSSSTSYDVPYDVVGRGDSYELRVYGAYYVAATKYENRERGLATLGVHGGRQRRGRDVSADATADDEIFRGWEDDGTGFARTTREREHRRTERGGDVRVVATGGELLAAATFEGNATPETAEFYRARLVDALAASGLSCADEREFRINTFGPLYSLAKRRNELLVRVSTG